MAILISTSPASPTTARNAKPDVAPAFVGPRPRNTSVGEQEQGRPPYLQLRPHKQPRSHLPDLLRMAHPRRAHGREVPRLPPHPEAPAPPQARRVGVHGRRSPPLRPLLRVRYDGGCGQGTGSFLRGSREGAG